MKGGLSGFFQRNDRLGTGISLNYNGTSEYGTVLGGCCTMFVWAIFLLFTTIQVFEWVLNANWSSNTTVSYIKPSDDSLLF